jgi:hypothetical protein
MIWNAMQDLVRRLSNTQCRDVANQQVFSKVNYGDTGGFGGHAVDPGMFVNYLRNTYHFYNGVKSTMNLQDAVCHNLGQSQCGPSIAIKDYFTTTTDGADTTVVTVTPSTPLKTFWQPVFSTAVSPGINPFGVGIDPCSVFSGCSTSSPTGSGVNIYNESTLFHEALHGFTSLSDDNLGAGYRLDTNIYLPGIGTTAISIYIKNQVLNASACNF